MLRNVRVRVGILALAASCLMLCVTPTSRAVSGVLPGGLDDRAFWSIVTEFSEPNGFFRSDNLVSNETEFQYVIPTLQERQTPASAYVGVGPEQNFTYIAALRPRIVFIVDVRRQNMLLQLMYKTIFETSPTRADFVSRLFARRKPLVAPNATAVEIFRAVENEPLDPGLAKSVLADVHKRLTHVHHFTLSADDFERIDYVYDAFSTAGADLRYSFGRGSGWFPFPSYQDLMIATDEAGVARSFLATEGNYQVVRDLERRNLIIPVVGDFSGPRALRSVAAYLRSHGATLSAFYTSNVEQYLFMGEEWQRFYANVQAMPLESHSTFIRAVFNNAFGRGGSVFRVTPAPYPLPPAPYPPTTFDRNGQPQPIGPRSVSVLHPISDLLAAVASGRIQSYRDLVELSVHE